MMRAIVQGNKQESLRESITDFAPTSFDSFHNDLSEIATFDDNDFLCLLGEASKFVKPCPSEAELRYMLRGDVGVVALDFNKNVNVYTTRFGNLIKWNYHLISMASPYGRPIEHTGRIFLASTLKKLVSLDNSQRFKILPCMIAFTEEVVKNG